MMKDLAQNGLPSHWLMALHGSLIILFCFVLRRSAAKKKTGESRPRRSVTNITKRSTTTSSRTTSGQRPTPRPSTRWSKRRAIITRRSRTRIRFVFVCPRTYPKILDGHWLSFCPQVEYIAVPKGGHVSAGVKLGHGPRQATQKTVQYQDGQDKDIDAVEHVQQSATVPNEQVAETQPAAAAPLPDERTDALTKKPLDLEAEEETRKLETSRWLESHFGSESSNSSAEGSSKGRSQKKKEEQDNKMPSQVSSGGINVTMTSDPQSGGSDRYDPNPPPPEPIINSRIYAQTGGLTGFNRPTQQNARYGPSGGEKRFVGSPPQSPTYKSSTSGYQSAAMNNGLNNPSSAVKRATSFNQSASNYSWMNKEELKGHQSSARQSFLSSMNAPEKYRQRQPDDGPTYAAPIPKRWPPPKPIDEDEDVRTSTPVYQTPQKPNRGGGGTIIRLGPADHSSSNGRGINRTQSLFQKQTEPVVYSSVTQHNTNRMNMLNSSLQSVPEREQQQRSRFSPQRSLFVDTERSFQSLNPSSSGGNPKVIQSYTIKSPPPRPAPPSHYGSPTTMTSPKLRGSESFRFPRSPPMFADDLTSPPVRPVRRKSKRAAKTDSGTQCNPQTIRNEIIQQQQSQTLDRPSKPMKKYYLGEDPFNNNKVVANGQVDSLSPLVQQPTRRTEVARSQTLPRRPSKPLLNDSSVILNNSNLSSSRVFSDQDRSLNETSGGGLSNNNRSSSRIIPITPAKSVNNNINLSTTSSVNRSQSFHVENQSATGQRRTSLLNSTPLRSVSIRAANSNSPLYKSTSFLNRSNEHQPFGLLKSPGIVTSISKSQLDLNKSSTELNSQPASNNNSALYTLPRRRSSTKAVTIPPPIDIQQQQQQPQSPTSVGKVQAGISERLAQLSPTSPDPGTRGESYSSLHRRKMQAASSPAPPTPPPPPPQPESPLANGPFNFQSSTKSTHRSYRGANETIKEENETKTNEPAAPLPEPELEPEARSLKDRIALLENAGIHYANPAQTLPRVVGGKTKAPPPPPPPRVSSTLQTKNREPMRNADKEDSPEVESIEKRQKFLEGLLNTAPELFMHIHGNENLKDMRMNREDVIDGKSGRLPRTPSPSAASPAFNNRVFTSTPVGGSNYKAAANPFGAGDVPLTPPPLLIRNSDRSPFGSQRDLALRRGSLNSTGSGSIIPAVKIPAPVNYSETVRIKSNQDPDSQSDSVQSYSKRVQPFVDGFSSETKQSSQQTTLTRSQYTDRRGSTDGALSPYYHSIRPQQSGGVIIQVRGSGQ